MPRVEIDVETTLPPEKVIEALTDFSDRRTEIWPDLAPEFYEIYSVGEKTAEVKEGSSMPGVKVWAREHYDWSEPGIVKWTVMESNFCTPGSGLVTTVEPRADGGSRVHVVWERTGSNLKGRVLCRMMKLTNGKLLSAGMKKAFGRLESSA